MFIQNWVKNMVHLVTSMIRTENMKTSVLEDNTVGFNICQGKQKEMNANSGLRNLVSWQALVITQLSESPSRVADQRLDSTKV